jgi:hypothetical protein
VRGLSRCAGSLVAGSLLLASAPASAPAAAPVPENFSAADQYVESVPTSEGSKPAGPGTGAGTIKPPPAVGSAGADQIEQIATSPELGAPRKKLHASRASEPAMPSAFVSAVGESEGSNFLMLALGLLLMTGVVAGTAGHRRYRDRQAAGSG